MDTADKEKLKLAFQEQAVAHREAREAFLTKAIKTVDDWLGLLDDPELGDIGLQFLRKAVKSGVRHTINIFFTNGLAIYSSFSYNPRGFLSEVTYGPSAEDSLPKLFSGKVHETTHALQKMNSAALHASPFNPDTKIIICPRDWITLEERCEQDAYARQAYFCSLLAPYVPDVRDATSGAALSTREFEKIRAAAPNIGAAMIEAARQALAASFYSDRPNSEYRFKNLVQDQALRNYEAGMAQRRKDGETGLVFVRLEPEDIAAIGASCGPNVFGDKGVLPEFLEKPVMLPDTLKKLNELDQDCKTGDADKLPTLTEALKKAGLTREEFIAQAYKKKSPPPPASAGNASPGH